jgi:hypothetical protein
VKEKARQLLREIEQEYGLLCGLVLQADRLAGDPFLWVEANRLSLRLAELRLGASKLHTAVERDIHSAAVLRAKPRRK